MFKTILKPNMKRCFSHTHSKTIFPINKNKNKDNNKVMEDLIIEQNKILEKIWESGQDIKLYMIFFGFALIIKPMR
jgi:hypothetical protein